MVINSMSPFWPLYNELSTRASPPTASKSKRGCQAIDERGCSDIIGLPIICRVLVENSSVYHFFLISSK